MIEVAGYDEAWAGQFAAERERLAAALGPWLDKAGIEHIGSTSVPGLAAKPIIDILCGVRDLATADAALGPMAALGYAHDDHRPDALWFHRDVGGVRTHHVHLTEPGSPLWRERLAFRDALRRDPGLAATYAALKSGLAASEVDVSAYTEGKRDFVVSVLRDAGIELRRR
ncbi:GrpB family protein [Hamadaea tsunoensis]|uniref:GrpB family protein n=1 Tax=Hamadaea tsunoensis TaxID=53368 RepID=UPI0004128DA7|nr:GrpB family protein [Hamadaea tsunoensis]